MRAFRIIWILGSLVAGALPAHAAGIVEVAFVTPAGYTDGGNDLANAEANRNKIAAYLQQLGQRQLASGETDIGIVPVAVPST